MFQPLMGIFMSRSGRYFALEQEAREERILNAYLDSEGLSRTDFDLMPLQDKSKICEMADEWHTEGQRNNSQFGVGA
jgi:hypothetical protein